MTRITWANAEKIFHKDGSLRDIYVFDTSFHEWNALWNMVHAEGYSLRYTKDGEESPIPTDAAAVLADRSCSHGLFISMGGIDITCGFYLCEEIELDVDPGQINSQEQLDFVLKFMADLGVATGKDVVLTEEMAEEEVRIRYSARDQSTRLIVRL